MAAHQVRYLQQGDSISARTIKKLDLNDHAFTLAFHPHGGLVYPSRLRKVIAGISILALFTSMVWASYSMPVLFVPPGNEGATEEDEEAIAYLSATGDRNLSVASDHQPGLILYSDGFTSPFDRIRTLWTSSSWK